MSLTKLISISIADSIEKLKDPNERIKQLYENMSRLSKNNLDTLLVDWCNQSNDYYKDSNKGSHYVYRQPVRPLPPKLGVYFKAFSEDPDLPEFKKTLAKSENLLIHLVLNGDLSKSQTDQLIVEIANFDPRNFFHQNLFELCQFAALECFRLYTDIRMSKLCEQEPPSDNQKQILTKFIDTYSSSISEVLPMQTTKKFCKHFPHDAVQILKTNHHSLTDTVLSELIHILLSSPQREAIKDLLLNDPIFPGFKNKKLVQDAYNASSESGSGYNDNSLSSSDSTS